MRVQCIKPSLDEIGEKEFGVGYMPYTFFYKVDNNHLVVRRRKVWGDGGGWRISQIVKSLVGLKCANT